VLSLDNLAEIERLYLQGKPVNAIAVQFGVYKRAIQQHIERHARPRWMERMASTADEEFAKVDLLYRIAWERFQESQKPQQTITVEQQAIKSGADPQVVKRSLTRASKTGEVCWLQVVQWCLDYKAKVNGTYAAEKHKHEHAITGSIRVAGATPEEFTREALRELIEAIDEREHGSQSGRNPSA
jgi:hypothetical protein